MNQDRTSNSCAASGFRRFAFGAAAVGLAATGAVLAIPSAALAQDELDLYTENAWALEQIHAEGAWSSSTGDGVTVAIVDTGISEHPFFEDKSVERGYSALDPDEEPDAYADVNGHGTGMAAAVLYAAPDVTVLPVRVSTGEDVGISLGAGENNFEGIRWAADNGADVMVIPWGELGGDGENIDPNPEFLEAVQYAIDLDIVVIASGGNDPALSAVGNPASFDGVVAVGGTDKDGAPWSGGTTSSDIELAAPADSMTYPTPQVFLSDDSLYFEAAGTSASAAIVGGVAALVRAAHPELDASNIIQRLIATADDGGAGKTDALGYGLVDADAAVNADEVDPVEENPLGYPMGEAGASGASPDDESSSEDAAVEPTDTQDSQPSAADDAGTGLTTIVVIAAAAVLLAAAVAVLMMLRSRARSKPPVQPWQ
ncbi:S8 family serine peptidase [Glycomyces buryatensis]|uniref:Peptidase S8/S53 domain-containing protein n=1 Tax=Glycomyces buryatensis TaxID=2570927 RepID=A0A4S8Q8D1_9ACTN|nr:S8 family serine peptidase [Glycomyces buryatensis]THV40643.1 hypothetical protein FAB82_15390 [Glycomyces buryatensis]